eukprot:scaffold6353_cov246-Chaetoceros_neogracile.AAC.1
MLTEVYDILQRSTFMRTLQCSQQSSSIWSSSWYPLTCIRYIGATGQQITPERDYTGILHSVKRKAPEEKILRLVARMIFKLYEASIL